MSNEIFRKVRIAKIRDSSFEDVVDKKSRALNYDKEKYIEMTLDAAETVLGTFGFDRTMYGDSKKEKRKMVAGSGT